MIVKIILIVKIFCFKYLRLFKSFIANPGIIFCEWQS